MVWWAKTDFQDVDECSQGFRHLSAAWVVQKEWFCGRKPVSQDWAEFVLHHRWLCQSVIDIGASCSLNGGSEHEVVIINHEG